MADQLSNTLSATGSGAVTGATLGGPWGALIGGGLGLLSTIPSWLTGQSQSDESKQLLSETRPFYTIPQAGTDALNLSKGLAKETRLPGQSAIEGRLDETTANKVSMLERMGFGGPDAINGASRAYGQQLDSENKLGEAAAANYNQNQKNLIGEEHNMANFEDQAFQYNFADPYAEDRSRGLALEGAGVQNKNTFFQNLLGTGANLAKGVDWNAIFNGGGSGVPSIPSGGTTGNGVGNNGSGGYTLPATKNIFDSLGGLGG